MLPGQLRDIWRIPVRRCQGQSLLKWAEQFICMKTKGIEMLKLLLVIREKYSFSGRKSWFLVLWFNKNTTFAFLNLLGNSGNNSASILFLCLVCLHLLPLMYMWGHHTYGTGDSWCLFIYLFIYFAFLTLYINRKS